MNYLASLIVLAKKKTTVDLREGYNRPLAIGKNITHLSFGRDFNNSISLVKKIQSFNVGSTHSVQYNYNQIFYQKILYIYHCLILTHALFCPKILYF